ncbi:MAG: HsdR family type I site-specific deoxyribonuclease [Clostridia bacterium]|nr:HsdR family type I site-specific deoxyribonuclease [Clostridia bacterium]
MTQIGDGERKTQDRVIEFFREQLHYTYIGNLREQENSNIIEDKLIENLKNRGYSDKLINGAVSELKKTSQNMHNKLYGANKEVYSLLKYGAKIKEEIEKPAKTVYFIDFDDITRNDFYIAEEVTVVGENVKRPDLVAYINGIAVAVIELKSSRVSVASGIRQNIANQKEHFIDKFFTTIQFCVAGNESEGMRYGTINTPEKYYLEWKEDGFGENEEDRDETDILIEEKCKDIQGRLFKDLINLFYKKRFLDLIHNFVVFDKGTKKLCRYNQYYAVKRAQNRLTKKKQGGIIWHTQGSGKSLSMVWLSKWILENNPDSRILIVTDRQELDEQIEKIFKGVDINAVRTRSGRDLLKKLNSFEDRLICSLIHKFGKRGKETKDEDYNQYIKDLHESFSGKFSVKGNVVVFVDECHRTQSGKLHEAMKTILPDSIFIGFTGTPLLKSDRKTSLEVFGSYIHTYKFNEAVSDGVVLDLRYESRTIPQDITSQERIDKWFEAKTAGLNDRAKAKLKSKWGNMQKVFSSKSRLEKIANDIKYDFDIIPRLRDGRGNAILVADSVFSACRYYEIFQSIGFKKCAIISSYEPYAGDIRTEVVGDDGDTDKFTKYEIYNKMLGGKSVDDFETEAKRQFVEEPENMKLLIVIDKLLTGFDAPSCTYLYIDKVMHDHTLFQAICRVNRLDGANKEFGYIVDYKELFGELSDAITTYTSGAFEKYNAEDVAGLIKNRNDEARRHFFEVVDELEELCEGVGEPHTALEYQHYFCGVSGDMVNTELLARSREKLYTLSNKLARAYIAFKPTMKDFEYSVAEQKKIEERVSFFINLHSEIGRYSGDFIDLKQYEPDMRYLVDSCIDAANSEKIAVLEDFTLLDFIINKSDTLRDSAKVDKQSAAEAIENNIRKQVVDKTVVNPAYYNKMSEILEQLILDRKKQVLSYKELIDKYIELAKNVTDPENNKNYPESVRNDAAMRAFYDNCGENEELAIALHNAVISSKLDGFRDNHAKQNKIKNAIYDILKDEAEVERIYRLIVEQEEY